MKRYIHFGTETCACPPQVGVASLKGKAPDKLSGAIHRKNETKTEKVRFSLSMVNHRPVILLAVQVRFALLVLCTSLGYAKPPRSNLRSLA